MGIFKHLFGGQDIPAPQTPAPVSPRQAESQPSVRVDVSFSMGEQHLVQVTGTTTFAKEAATALAHRHGITGDGYLECMGTLQREPENKADPRAVVILVEGERIGYLPGYVAREQDLTISGARPAPVQIFFELLPKGLRAEAWAWLGDGLPRWQWSQANRPPMSPSAKAAARHAGISNMVDQALAEGGARAASFEAGMVSGVHYLQLVEPIKQLKREGRLNEALELCNAAIEGAEAAREGRAPAPWYTEQAAIIYRKLGQRENEISVLGRWLRACPPEHREGSRIKDRLDKISS